MIDERNKAIRGMRTGRENEVLRENLPIALPFHPPQIPHELA
jgi:hypothetical protein